MNPLNLVTEPYDRQARLYPALLLVAPIVATGAGLLSSNLTAFQSFGASAAGLGGAFLLTQLARDAGKKGEKGLFEKWGGLPSVAIFRHRDTRLDSITKARYHKKLAGLVKEAKAPTAEQEHSDPDSADIVYSAWSYYLRVNTRDIKKFSHLFRENVNYGYRRNVWGMRTLGLVASLSCLVCSVVRLLVIRAATGKIDEVLLCSGVFALFILLLWAFRFTGDWVYIPANAYAERLAESTETLEEKVAAAKSLAKKMTPKKV